MYKRLTYDELLQLKTSFFDTLAYILKKNRYPSLKDYIKVVRKQGDTIYHMMRQDFVWRTVIQSDSSLIFYDEREKIELHADMAIISKINSMLIDPRKIKKQHQQSQSIEQILQQAFDQGELTTIQGSDYLVYDIETSYATDDLKTLDFYLGYAYIVQWGKGTYRYIDRDNLHKFVDYMLSFDGYIIGFNSLAFDNPVSVYNALRFQDKQHDTDLYESQLEEINRKSLDIFQFVQKMTGKRMGLQKLSKAFVGISKTLESGKEGENLWKLYEEWDDKALDTLKKYCKNDVKMTYLVLWYIVYYRKMSLDGDDIVYTIDDIIEYGTSQYMSISENIEQESNQLFD